MDHTIVIGAFSFVGFHLSKSLLEEGLFVYGIATDQYLGIEDYLDQKKMAIGRNSNLYCIDENRSESWKSKISKEVDVLFFTIDLRSQIINEDSSKVEHLLYEAINYCQNNSIKMVFLSTTEVVDHSESNITEQSIVAPLTPLGGLYVKLEQMIVDECEKKRFAYLILRVPTIYGPWQPEAYAYQRIIRLLEAKEDVSFIKDDYMGDVLYVDDAIKAIKKAASTTITENVVHITTGRVGEWIKGINFLLETKCSNRQPEYFLSNEKAKELLDFIPTTCIEEGLKNQREHLRFRLYNDLY